jgi:hypothetical protein
VAIKGQQLLSKKKYPAESSLKLIGFKMKRRLFGIDQFQKNNILTEMQAIAFSSLLF